MERLNFGHLFYFYMVSKIGSIKEASEKLHVSQPTISDQIKLLEQYFDCLLFDRKNRSLILTKEGKVALDYAEKIFDLSRDLTHRLRNNLNIPKSSIDVGISFSMSHYFLFDNLLPLFDQQKFSVKIKEGQRHLLIADLEEGLLDIVFTDDKSSITANMECFRVGVNRTYAVSHKKFKKRNSKFPDCLNAIPFFNYTSDTVLKYEIDLFFRKNSLSPKVLGEADDIDFLETIVGHGHCFVIVPEVAKNRFCRNNDVVVLGEIDDFQSSVWGVVKKDYDGILVDLLKK